jgi:putative peptide zinc metalloprotease protein
MLSPCIGARRILLRGTPFYVLHNPATGRYLRLPARSWLLLAQFDGRRRLGEAIARLPASAPGEADDTALAEAIPALAAAGFVAVAGARPPDPKAAPMPLRALRGAMVIRLPVGDLAPVLRLAGPVLAIPYTRAGAILVLLAMALAALLWAGRADVLADQLRRFADPDLADLGVWYAIFVASKLLHECGHAIAAQRMAAAEAHHIASFPFGINFMFLLPAPYVDVSGTWFVADRRRRALVGFAGIWMDLAVASMAACIAALLAAGALRDGLFDLVVIAGVSSLLFNANPLVRLDGYYVLSDLLEIANLQARAQAAMLRWLGVVFGLSRPRRGDAGLAVYGIASLLYRFVIFASVFWLAGGAHWSLAAGVAGVVFMVYLALPGIVGIRALARAFRARPIRATLALGTAAAGLAAILLVPAPRWLVAHGIAWNDSLSLVFAGADGRVGSTAPAGAQGPAMVLRLENPETLRLRQQLGLEAESLAIEARRASAGAPQRIDTIEERRRAVATQDQALAAEVAAWDVAAPAGTRWEPGRAEQLAGGWVRRDDARPLGALVGPGPVLIRLVLDQANGPEVLAVLAEAPDHPPLAVRRLGEARPLLHALPMQVRPDARDELPSPALAAPNGGPFAMRADPAGTMRPAERVFELRLAPIEVDKAGVLLHGQRVEVLVPLPPAPLAQQIWQGARRLFQQRLGA